MPLSDRIKYSAIAAVSALFVGTFAFLLANRKFVPIILGILITIAVAFVALLIVNHVVAQKTFKVRVIAYAIAAAVCLTATCSAIIIGLGNAMMFYPRIDKKATQELTEMAEGGAGSSGNSNSSGNSGSSNVSSGLRAEALSIDDGAITGWRIPASGVDKTAKRPVLLYFGGNAETAANSVLGIVKTPHRYQAFKGCDIVCFDYPGYGTSKGTPRAGSIRQMASKAYKAAADLPTTSDVIIMGYSLGSGIAVYTASLDETKPLGLIVISGYHNSYDVYNNALNIFHGPFKLLATNKLPVYSYANKVRCNTLLLASDSDETIPIDSSKALFSEFKASKADFVTITGKSHNEITSDAEVSSRIGSFVSDLLNGRETGAANSSSTSSAGTANPDGTTGTDGSGAGASTGEAGTDAASSAGAIFQLTPSSSKEAA